MTDQNLTPRERRYQRTQQAILSAARAIIAEEGADKLSMRAIADRIDYSPAGLYEYFGSKEEIIGTLCWEGHRMLKRYMDQVPLAMEPDEYMVELGMSYIRFAVQNPDYFLLIFTTAGTRPDFDGEVADGPTQEMMNEDSSFPVLLKGVDRAAKAGCIQLLEGMGLIETAYAFWSIVHGAAMLRVTYLSAMKVDFDRADRLMLTAFVRGMSV